MEAGQFTLGLGIRAARFVHKRFYGVFLCNYILGSDNTGGEPST